MSDIIQLFSNIGEVRKDEADELTRIWTISNSDVDMHRTILPVDNWDLDFFNRAGSFYYQHITDGNGYVEPNPDLALGPARARVEGTELVGVGKFEPKDLNKLADTIMRKVDYGTMRMTSVGFAPIEGEEGKGHWGREKDGEDPEIYVFGRRRLLEFSCVHIASNLSAEKKSIDSMNQFLLKEICSHPSKSYQEDFKRRISRDSNKTIIVPKTVEKVIKENVDSMTLKVMEHQLFINKNFKNV